MVDMDHASGSDASSLSSTPILSLKQTSMKKQQRRDQKNASKDARIQPKTANVFPSTCVIADGGKSGTSESEEEEEEKAACCLCHCGMDCSDRALFFQKDRKMELEEDEDYYFSLDDPYLDGEKHYDRNNALVYCDTCDRLYHQKCHFVPLLVVPRGEFHCLICSIQREQQKKALQGKKKPSKIKNRHGTIEPKPVQSSTISEKFLKRKITDKLFQSPPNISSKTIDVKTLEKEWEVESAPAKARLWDLQFKQLRTFLKSQASNIRMANTTLATMTSTKRNRQHFLEISAKTGSKSSQELAQTLCKLTGAKFKIRQALLSLESLRVSDESINFSDLYDWSQKHVQHADHVFPFGSTFCKDRRRIVPRTRERNQESKECKVTKMHKLKGHYDNADNIVPSEITISDSSSNVCSRSNESSSLEVATKSSKGSPRSNRGEKKRTHMTKQKNPDNTNSVENDEIDNDDDSGITLDDLKCSICMIGDATDENDVILCDGKDCHRAYHMKCVYPPVKQEDIENEDEDWFCPICSKSTEIMGEIHDLCVGDENDESSTGSWDDVFEDVFPGSQWEYETSLKILKGKRNEDTQRLLAMFLGEDINKKKVQMPVGSDSEDENDYSLFDEDSFQERRRQEREDESDGRSGEEDSVCSSQATLQEMENVDYKVGKAELAALSDEECSTSDSDDESENKIRRSRRLERKEEVGESNLLDCGADFDEANIIEGKRKRKRVNYRKLNDMMFGDLSDHQQGIIDGGDDFDTTKTKLVRDGSENEESNGNASDNGSDNTSENELASDSDDNSAN